MRMQNADMEFVTFDAHDVIATSGGPEGLLMKVGVAAAYNNHQKDEKYKLKSYSGTNIGDGSSKAKWITFDPDDYITWANKANDTQQKTEGVSYKVYETYDNNVYNAIVDWLKQQCIQ